MLDTLDSHDAKRTQKPRCSAKAMIPDLPERIAGANGDLSSIFSAVPVILDLADEVEEHWFDLSDEMQNVAINAMHAFEKLARNVSGRRSVSDHIVALIRGVWRLPGLVINADDRLRFNYAALRLSTAVKQALAEEQRRRRAMEKRMENEPALQEAIAVGEREYQDRQQRPQGVRFSKAEILSRIQT